ncbi:MAG: hypothetical protein K6F92_04285 [Lachnospiraceae bacterium]|nr:hypothetical protein [Lachnospiraceae bacterium]
MAFLDQLKNVAKTVGDKTVEVAKAVGEKTSEAAKAVGDKTNETIEVTKLKSKISSEKSAIADIKKQIGELVYEEFTAGGSYSEGVAALIASIKDHESLIAKAEADIEATKNKVAEVAEEATEAVEEKVEEVKEAAEKTEE